MSIAGEHTRQWVSGQRILLAGGVAAALAVLLTFLGQVYVFQVFPVASRSMAPTLLPDDVVLVNRLVYHLRLPRRGDVIVFRYPQGGDRRFLKRVIAVPGDTIEEQNGQLWVNGSLAGPEAQPQLSKTVGASENLPQRVPAGEFFVLGDNPGMSLDSRFWGTVKIHDVVGKALLICWSYGPQWWHVHWHRLGRWLQ